MGDQCLNNRVDDGDEIIEAHKDANEADADQQGRAKGFHRFHPEDQCQDEDDHREDNIRFKAEKVCNK